MRLPAAAPALVASAALAACAGPETDARVTVLGSANFLPGPAAPVSPSLAEAILARAGAEEATLRATGNGEAMAILCRRGDALADLARTGDTSILRPDIVILSRAPVALELELCRRNGIETGTYRLATYTGGIPGDADIEGIWLVWDRRQVEASEAAERALRTARAEAPALIDATRYGQYFRAGS